MVNQWIMFLRQYSKDNNISYSCAITEAAPSYRKMKEEMKNKEEEKPLKGVLELPRAADPKIFSKIVKVKKNPKGILEVAKSDLTQKQKKQKEEEEEDDEVPKLDNDENPERDLELPNAADNYIELMNKYADETRSGRTG